MNKKILVIGGIHGNEPLGIELVKLIENEPINHVDTLLANKRAIKMQIRFVETDLNRSFGAKQPRTYEEKLAERIEKYTRNYDLVLDFHNTQAAGNDCSFIGIDSNRDLFTTTKRLGLNRCIKVNYDCINKYCKNAISIEISLSSQRNNALFWYEIIKSLAESGISAKPNKICLYEFERRVTWAEKEKYKLNNWKPFVEISELEKMKLNVSGIITPIFIGSKLTEYYATLVRKERVG